LRPKSYDVNGNIYHEPSVAEHLTNSIGRVIFEKLVVCHLPNKFPRRALACNPDTTPT